MFNTTGKMLGPTCQKVLSKLQYVYATLLLLLLIVYMTHKKVVTSHSVKHFL